ncbi:MAG TPA: TetR/AcrR family transcriptional regulator [Dehalococcoidia bacterium]|nr:TetR/AcrR family transcriptional regulator [Dehalococcoidia bacterium]
MTTAEKVPPKRRRSREETRQRLLDAALGVFARNGFERATVDEIVREAGFSKGAFYVHFESKEDLFWEILRERIEANQRQLRETIEPGLDVVEAERRILTTLFDARKTEPLGPAVYYEFVAHAMRNDKVRERLAEFYASWHAFVVETLRLGRESGMVRDDVDLELQASALMATFEGALIQSQLAPEGLRLSDNVESFAKLLADWVVRR